jgi:uncharacterized protein YqgC (DUF456 family)
MEPFSNLADFILILFLLAGLTGTFIPILPGPTLIVIGGITHALMRDFQPLGWLPLTILVTACIIATLGQTMLTGIGTHTFGGTKYGMIGGTVGLIGGIFLPFPGGMLVGAFGGAILCELYFAKQEFKLAAKAGLGGVLGLLASFLFEIAITFSMAIYVVALFY